MLLDVYKRQVLVQNIAVGDDITVAIWECLGYTVLLCYTLFRTGSLAKSLLDVYKRQTVFRGSFRWPDIGSSAYICSYEYTEIYFR